MKKRLFNTRYFIVLLGAALFALFLSTRASAKNIVIYGDSQLYEDTQRKVVQAILPFKPSIVFRVGDLVDDGYSVKQWKRSMEINKPLLTTAEYFPAIGNHERDAVLYFENFPFLKGKRWYSVEREGIHFIVLDSNRSMSPDSEQYQWLEADLKSIKKSIKFKIAIFHHPLFSVGRHAEDEKHLRPVLLPLFERYRVSAVFSGHDHSYQRFEYEGMRFVVTGGGGSLLVSANRTSPYLKKFKTAHHFCLLSPGRNSVRVRIIDIDSKEIDEFKILAENP